MTTYAIELNNNYANQEFDLILDDIKNTIHVLLQTVNNALLMTVSINNNILGAPFLCIANTPIIPYQYLQDNLGGNFVFETVNNNYPNYENFGKTCNLYFFTLDEITNAN